MAGGQRVLVLILGVSLVAGSLAFSPASAGAAEPVFTPLDYPGAARSAAFGINNLGQVVGDYTDRLDITSLHGWVWTDGVFTPLDFPGQNELTRGYAINDLGDIVGIWRHSRGSALFRGFVLIDGVYTSLDVGGPDGSTSPTGIDDAGNIVGSFCGLPFTESCKKGGIWSGFYLEKASGALTIIQWPGSPYTEAWKSNGTQILGRYLGADGNFHLYTYDIGGGTINDILQAGYPGAVETASQGFSNTGGFTSSGAIATNYCSAEPCAVGWDSNKVGFGFTSDAIHGFIEDTGVFTSVDFPGAGFTAIWDMNEAGAVVGGYMDSGISEHGYLRLSGR
jgi:uncharacterized membrane protein